MLDRDLLIKIDDKLDKFKDEFHTYKSQAQEEHTKMALDLKEHMFRTDIVEKRQEHIENDIKPVLESFQGVKFLFGVVSFLLASGLITILIKLFH